VASHRSAPGGRPRWHQRGGGTSRSRRARLASDRGRRTAARDRRSPRRRARGQSAPAHALDVGGPEDRIIDQPASITAPASHRSSDDRWRTNAGELDTAGARWNHPSGFDTLFVALPAYPPPIPSFDSFTARGSTASPFASPGCVRFLFSREDEP
jgi:hypothetical protein